MSIPGQPTEEAVAEVGSEAGRSLIRGLGKLASASTSEWTAKREAKAEAARIAIETDTKIKTDAALTAARREKEVAEFDHRAALERRAARLRIELAREQLNLEAVERRAIEYTERDPGNSKAREIDEDWLSSLPISHRRFLTKTFKLCRGRAFFCCHRRCPHAVRRCSSNTWPLRVTHCRKFQEVCGCHLQDRCPFPYVPSGEKELQNIDLGGLFDLDLMAKTHTGPLELERFSFGEGRTGNLALAMLQSHLRLTRRGYDIAAAVFRAAEDLPLSEELEQRYLRLILQDQVRQLRNATIVTKLEHVDPPITIRLTNKSGLSEGTEKFDWKSSTNSGC